MTTTTATTLCELNLYAELNRDHKDYECDYNIYIGVDKDAYKACKNNTELLAYLKTIVSDYNYKEIAEMFSGPLAGHINFEDIIEDEDDIHNIDELGEVQIVDYYADED